MSEIAPEHTVIAETSERSALIQRILELEFLNWDLQDEIERLEARRRRPDQGVDGPAPRRSEPVPPAPDDAVPMWSGSECGTSFASL
jgi:hypothetical protein